MSDIPKKPQNLLAYNRHTFHQPLSLYLLGLRNWVRGVLSTVFIAAPCAENKGRHITVSVMFSNSLGSVFITADTQILRVKFNPSRQTGWFTYLLTVYALKTQCSSLWGQSLGAKQILYWTTFMILIKQRYVACSVCGLQWSVKSACHYNLYIGLVSLQWLLPTK